MVFKVDADGTVEQLDLFDVSLGDGYIRPFGDRGFRVLPNDTLYIAAGSRLLEIDLTHARWSRIA